MKKTITLFFVVLFSIGLFAQEKISRVRINLEGKSIQGVASLGIDVLEGNYRKGVFFETDLSSAEQARLAENGFLLTVQIDDVTKFYADRATAEKNLTIDRSTDAEWVVPQNWEYGSMGGYYNLDEVMAELDDMRAMYPDLVSERKAISEDNLTHDGRKQYWVKISDNPDSDEDEPEILYSGLHHAREAITPQLLVFYMWYLLENYDTDAEIKRIVDNTELYFVPVINPDGFEYNYQTNPNGGGYWRKNRRDNLDGSFGVDPNRNYGFMWGLNDEGSSPYTTEETYRGPEAFSEPEIQNIRDFCNAHEFKITLNYHSYSNLLLSPWGFTPDPSPDNDLLVSFAQLMTLENGYTYGPGSTTIYPTNGGSDDWMYGEQDTKEKIYSYTPEVGGGDDGFWPAVSRIIPLCKENMWQNLTAARLVGKYAVVNDLSGSIIAEVEGHFPFDITRLGLAEADNYVVSIEPLDEFMAEVGAPVEIESLELLQTLTDSIAYTLSTGIESGQIFSYLLSVDNGDFIVSDTISKIYGIELPVFEDNGEDMQNWTSSKWTTTTSDFHSPTHSITDSPSGDYQHDDNNIISLDTIIDLRGVNIAFLKFWAKWEIEAGYDYAQLQAKEVSASNWVSLPGKFTKTGSQYQDAGKPVYDGFQDWLLEEIDLSSFAGKEIEFRFRLVSDSYVKEDGFYFDDFVVSVVTNTTGIKPVNSGSGFFISDSYPNPANNTFSVQFDLNQSKGNFRLELYDAIGNKLNSQQLASPKGVVKMDVSTLPRGIYFYRITDGNLVSVTKKLIKY